MRILITGQTYYPAKNGQAIFMVNLAEGLARRGHTVQVLIPDNFGGADTSVRNGVQIGKIKSLRLNYLHQDIAYTVFQKGEIARIMHQFHPDIVHIHDHYPISRAALKAARDEGIRVIGTDHFMPENLEPYIPFSSSLKPALNWALWNWMLELYNQLDLVTAPSKTAACILRSQGLHKHVYPVSCGVNLEAFHPIPGINRKEWRDRYGLDAGKTLFLFVGRVDGEKRLDVLLRAVYLLNRPDIQLGIVGKGAAQTKLAELAEELHLENQIRFTGYVPGEDLPSLLNSADLFAMPSEAELLSIATLEAMACGLPVMAARSQALPELVEEGVNGSLFEPGNPSDAAFTMGMLADHTEKFPEWGNASLHKARAHNLDNVLRQYEQIYRFVAKRESHTINHRHGSLFSRRINVAG
jgi:1,2-diacylglycerol 3-alpha-glucosyltransferase